MKKLLSLFLIFFCLFSYNELLLARNKTYIPDSLSLSIRIAACKDTICIPPSCEFEPSIRWRVGEWTRGDNQDFRRRHKLRVYIQDYTRSKWVDAGFRLAAGTDDPLVLDDGLGERHSQRNFYFDRYWVDFHFPATQKYFSLVFGKMKNPFYTAGNTELIWDSDLNPEGFCTRLDIPGGNWEVLANLGRFSIESRPRAADALMLGAQGCLKYKFPGNYKPYLLAGASYYDYINTRGYAPFYLPGLGFGNSLDSDGNYREDFNDFEAFAEFGFKARAIPVAFFGDYVTNTGAYSEKEAWLVGFYAGKCRESNSWAIRYNYREMKRDAVIGLFTDSNFCGGNTARRGHEIGMDFKVREIPRVGVTFYRNERILTRKHYQRFQIELAL